MQLNDWINLVWSSTTCRESSIVILNPDWNNLCLFCWEISFQCILVWIDWFIVFDDHRKMFVCGKWSFMILCRIWYFGRICAGILSSGKGQLWGTKPRNHTWSRVGFFPQSFFQEEPCFWGLYRKRTWRTKQWERKRIYWTNSSTTCGYMVFL